MNILGISNGAESGAALFRDGKIVAAVTEERFVREKGIATFPQHSIEYVLGSERLRVEDIDWLRGVSVHETDDDAVAPDRRGVTARTDAA